MGFEYSAFRHFERVVMSDWESLKNEGYRAYLVSVDVEMAVVAKSPEDARRIACRNISNETSALCEHDFYDRALDIVPLGWDADSICYSDLKKDITINEVIKKNSPNA